MSGGGGGSPGEREVTQEDLRKLRDKFYGPGGELRDLAHLRSDYNEIPSDEGSFGFMAKNRQEIFSHHTYDLIKKLQNELALMTGARDALGELLELEKKKVADYEDARFWTEKAYENQLDKYKSRVEDPNAFYKEVKEALVEIQEQSEWGYHTLVDRLKFGLDEEQAVYRRESRCKGVFMTTISRVKELINFIGEV